MRKLREDEGENVQSAIVIPKIHISTHQHNSHPVCKGNTNHPAQCFLQAIHNTAETQVQIISCKML